MCFQVCLLTAGETLLFCFLKAKILLTDIQKGIVMYKYKKENSHAGMKSLILLLHEMRLYKWYSTLLPWLACISQVSQSLILIMLPKYVLDAVSGNRSFEVLVMQTAIIGLGLIVTTLMNLIVRNEIDKCSQMFLFQRLTSMWQRKTISLDYNIFISGQGKVLMEKAREVISSPNWGIVELLKREASLLEAGAGLIVYCILVGKLHPLILVLLSLFFIVELIAGVKIEDKKQDFKEQRAKANRRLNYIAYGTKGIKEAKDIRIFSMVPMLKKITQDVIQGKCKVESEVQRWQFARTFITAAFILIRDSAAYIFLIYRYLTSSMSIGDFSMYFAAITGVGMWLTKLSNSITGWKEVGRYIRDFYEFMLLPEDNVSTPVSASDDIDKSEMSIGSPVSFELKNISFSYSKQTEKGEQEIPIIKNFNLHVNAGEKIAIVGVNGAGKSTLIKLLCGILTPDSGKIFVNGVDSKSFSKKKYYELFSAVFQKSQILPVSIADNIMLNIKRENDKEAMWDCVRKAGLEEKIMSLPAKEQTCLLKQVSEDGTQLSGGQEQRLLLARALYKDAPILLLDEPTAALDPVSENEIYQKYCDLTAGKTSFFVSHRLASTRFCDRIIFMENGTIAEMGTHDELMQMNGKYADMFAVQSKYYQEGGIRHEEKWKNNKKGYINNL